MKEAAFVVMILASSVALNRLSAPSELEKASVLWHRQAREERELMTKEMLTMRDDINHQLKLMESEVNAVDNGTDLETLRSRIEQSNRVLQHVTSEAKDLTRDSWADAKDHTERQIAQMRLELMRLQKQTEEALSSNE